MSLEISASMIFYVLAIVPTILGIYITSHYIKDNWLGHLTYGGFMFIMTVVCILVGLGFDGYITIR